MPLAAACVCSAVAGLLCAWVWLSRMLCLSAPRTAAKAWDCGCSGCRGVAAADGPPGVGARGVAGIFVIPRGVGGTPARSGPCSSSSTPRTRRGSQWLCRTASGRRRRPLQDPCQLHVEAATMPGSSWPCVHQCGTAVRLGKARHWCTAHLRRRCHRRPSRRCLDAAAGRPHRRPVARCVPHWMQVDAQLACGCLE